MTFADFVLRLTHIILIDFTAIIAWPTATVLAIYFLRGEIRSALEKFGKKDG